MQAEEILQSLAAADNLRQLTTLTPDGYHVWHEGRRLVNFSSNDYLGLTADMAMQRGFFASIDPSRFLMSNPASRLMTGNSPEYDVLEDSLARMFAGDRRALVLSSGFMVNAGVLPALTGKGDLILADKLVHASVIEGLKLSAATHMRFNHNDMAHLGRLLGKYRGDYGDVWVAVESVYSMDGDCAPVEELVALKERFDIKLYIDEAHAFGVCGDNGAGLAAGKGLDDRFDIIVATLGKAVASCGAFVICAPAVRELLVNRMRTLIFSSALPPLNLLWSRWVVDRLPDMGERRRRLRELADVIAPGGTASHIIPLMAYDNARALELGRRLRDEGFWVTAVRWPTVPKGAARLRLSLSAAIDLSDAEKLIEVWNSIG